MTRVLISDFGGVLTSPLEEIFLAYQKESDISFEELGRAMGKATEQHGDHPLFALERGEISELEFRDRIEAHLEESWDVVRLRDNETVKPQIKRYRDLQAKAQKACFISDTK